MKCSKNLLLALNEVYTQDAGADELLSTCAIVLARTSRTSPCKIQLLHPALRYLCPRAIFKADWLYSPFTVMEPAPKVFTAFSINLNLCPADTTTISSLQLSRQSRLWCCPSSVSPCWEHPRFQTQSTWLCCFWWAEAEGSSCGNSSTSTVMHYGWPDGCPLAFKP